MRIESPSAFGGRWAWLAPMMGCCLVLMVVSSTRTPQFGNWSASGPTDWLAAVASNQSYAAYVPGSFHSEQNAVQAERIEWTNGARVEQQPRLSGQLVTNSLIKQ